MTLDLLPFLCVVQSVATELIVWGFWFGTRVTLLQNYYSLSSTVVLEACWEFLESEWLFIIP